MGAALNDATTVNDEDSIRVADCAQPVCDERAGAAFHQPEQGFLGARLAASINAAGGLVQDKYACSAKMARARAQLASHIVAFIFPVARYHISNAMPRINLNPRNTE